MCKVIHVVALKNWAEYMNNWFKGKQYMLKFRYNIMSEHTTKCKLHEQFINALPVQLN